MLSFEESYLSYFGCAPPASIWSEINSPIDNDKSVFVSLNLYKTFMVKSFVKICNIIEIQNKLRDALYEAQSLTENGMFWSIAPKLYSIPGKETQSMTFKEFETEIYSE